MSQAERHAKQRDRMSAVLAEELRQRQALTPTPIARAVRTALGGRLDVPAAPLWLYIELGAVSDPRRRAFSGAVR